MRSGRFVAFLAVTVTAGAGSLVGAAAPRVGMPALRFVSAPEALIAECRATARSVGYPVPCPRRVPAGLTAYGGRAGCELAIVGPGMKCPDTALSWRGWVVGSSISGDEHLVVTASPHSLRSDSKVVNGPAWYPGARVRALGFATVNGQRMHEVYAPPATNDGSAFAGHVVLIWTTGGHTYGVGFHDVHGIARTLAFDLELARGITLMAPH